MYVCGWMDRWMDGWMDGRMDGMDVDVDGLSSLHA